MTDKDYIEMVVEKDNYKSLMEEVLKTFSKLGYFVEIKEENK
jgi:hypothetical protein